MWTLVIVINLLFFFFAWIGVSLYIRSIGPKKIFEHEKSYYKLKKKSELTFVTNKEGEKTELLTIPNQDSKELIIYFHGSAGRLVNVLYGASRIGTVVSPAYSGYHESEGQPSFQSVYETVDLTMNYLAKKGYKQENITVLGHSLGGSAAVYAAVHYPKLKKVVLVNAFYSVQRLCEMQYSIFCAFTYDFLNNGSLAPQTQARIVQFHDKNDKIVPFQQGQDLFEKLGSADKKFFVHGGTHRFFNVEQTLTKE